MLHLKAIVLQIHLYAAGWIHFVDVIVTIVFVFFIVFSLSLSFLFQLKIHPNQRRSEYTKVGTSSM